MTDRISRGEISIRIDVGRLLRTSAIYAEHEALVRIDNGSLLRGELPRTAARLVEQWRELHQDELMKEWRLAPEPAALFAIEPLQ